MARRSRVFEKWVENAVPCYINEKKEAFINRYDGSTASMVPSDSMEMVLDIHGLRNVLGDEGCDLHFFQTGLNMQVTPLRTYWFDDGLYILNAALEYEDPISAEWVEQLNGTFNVKERKLNLEGDNGKLSLKMSGKMKSFFEIQAQLNFHSKGALSTDVEGVFLHYGTDSLMTLEWKKYSLTVD
jgi:hypothetical protein